MNRTAAAVILFVAAAVLVATGDRATTQPYAAVPSQTAHWQAPVVLSKADAARLDRIGDLLEQIAKNTAPAAAKATGPDVAAVAKARCARCHTPANAKGGFSLFADEAATVLRPLSPFEKGVVMRDVLDGTMPKNAQKLAGAELAAFESAFQK